MMIFHCPHCGHQERYLLLEEHHVTAFHYYPESCGTDYQDEKVEMRYFCVKCMSHLRDEEVERSKIEINL